MSPQYQATSRSLSVGIKEHKNNLRTSKINFVFFKKILMFHRHHKIRFLILNRHGKIVTILLKNISLVMSKYFFFNFVVKKLKNNIFCYTISVLVRFLHIIFNRARGTIEE